MTRRRDRERLEPEETRYKVRNDGSSSTFALGLGHSNFLKILVHLFQNVFLQILTMRTLIISILFKYFLFNPARNMC